MLGQHFFCVHFGQLRFMNGDDRLEINKGSILNNFKHLRPRFLIVFPKYLLPEHFIRRLDLLGDTVNNFKVTREMNKDSLIG